jgi:hypothetical protein
MNRRRRGFTWLVLLPWLTTLAACASAGVEVDDAAIIGSVYEVVGSVYAIGVRSDLGSQRRFNRVESISASQGRNPMGPPYRQR